MLWTTDYREIITNAHTWRAHVRFILAYYYESVFFSSEKIDLCTPEGDVKQLYCHGDENAAHFFTLRELCLVVRVQGSFITMSVCIDTCKVIVLSQLRISTDPLYLTYIIWCICCRESLGTSVLHSCAERVLNKWTIYLWANYEYQLNFLVGLT